MIIMRCCNCHAATPPCPCDKFEDSEAPCCYALDFSGFTGTKADLNDCPWNADYVGTCGWSCDLQTDLGGGYVELNVTEDDGDYIVTVSLGPRVSPFAVFTLNYGSTKPTKTTTFTDFTRTTGSEGTLVSATPSPDHCACPSLDGCTYCTCKQVPQYLQITLSGTTDNLEDIIDCTDCASWDGTYVLELGSDLMGGLFPGHCSWFYQFANDTICGLTPRIVAGLAYYGGKYHLLIYFCTTLICSDGFGMYFDYDLGTTKPDCLEDFAGLTMTLKYTTPGGEEEAICHGGTCVVDYVDE